MNNGDLTSTDQETANVLNNYFASVFASENDQNIPSLENRHYNMNWK